MLEFWMHWVLYQSNQNNTFFLRKKLWSCTLIHFQHVYLRWIMIAPQIVILNNVQSPSKTVTTTLHYNLYKSINLCIWYEHVFSVKQYLKFPLHRKPYERLRHFHIQTIISNATWYMAKLDCLPHSNSSDLLKCVPYLQVKNITRNNILEFKNVNVITKIFDYSCKRQKRLNKKKRWRKK